MNQKPVGEFSYNILWRCPKLSFIQKAKTKYTFPHSLSHNCKAPPAQPSSDWEFEALLSDVSYSRHKSLNLTENQLPALNSCLYISASTYSLKQMHSGWETSLRGILFRSQAWPIIIQGATSMVVLLSGTSRTSIRTTSRFCQPLVWLTSSFSGLYRCYCV